MKEEYCDKNMKNSTSSKKEINLSKQKITWGEFRKELNTEYKERNRIEFANI